MLNIRSCLSFKLESALMQILTEAIEHGNKFNNVSCSIYLQQLEFYSSNSDWYIEVGYSKQYNEYCLELFDREELVESSYTASVKEVVKFIIDVFY